MDSIGQKITLDVQLLQRIASKRFGFDLDEMSAGMILKRIEETVKEETTRWLNAAKATQLIIDKANTQAPKSAT